MRGTAATAKAAEEAAEARAAALRREMEGLAAERGKSEAERIRCIYKTFFLCSILFPLSRTDFKDVKIPAMNGPFRIPFVANPGSHRRKESLVCLSDPLQYMKRLEFQEGDRAVEGGGISAGGEHQRPRRPRGEARGVGKGQPGHGHRSEGEYRAGLPNSHAVD